MLTFGMWYSVYGIDKRPEGWTCGCTNVLHGRTDLPGVPGFLWMPDRGTQAVQSSTDLSCFLCLIHTGLFLKRIICLLDHLIMTFDSPGHSNSPTSLSTTTLGKIFVQPASKVPFLPVSFIATLHSPNHEPNVSLFQAPGLGIRQNI